LDKDNDNTPRPNPFKKIDGLLAPGNQGMIIDLKNGHIDAYDFKLSSKGI
jgi:hypothetical protein